MFIKNNNRKKNEKNKKWTEEIKCKKEQNNCVKMNAFTTLLSMISQTY